jgi:formylmethanofuran dehydrogenase subunit E
MSIPKDILNKAISLHGHLGPFLVLGVKIGLFIKKVWNDKIDLCILKTINKKPQLCTADGLKTILGINNVKISNGEGISIEIHKGENKIAEIFIKKEIIDKYVNVPWEKCEEAAYEILAYKEEELFIVKGIQNENNI